MKTQEISSVAELGPLEERIAESASLAVTKLLEICASNTPLDSLRRIKFESVGYDPLSQGHLNLIEQVNQTFTYLATFQAVRYLFKRHAQAGPFTINLGTAGGPDILSKDGKLVAEVFAAVTPGSNRKLKKDAQRVGSIKADIRYVFYACPDRGRGDMGALPDYPNVRIVSLGVPFPADYCAT
jgi:hypothetical protein